MQLWIDMTRSIALHPDHELVAHVPNTKRNDLVARDSILNLLSSAELARVSSAEESANLAANDEYIDLTHLDDGVLRAPVAPSATGRMLPRSAVSAETWTQILAMLEVRTS